MEYKDINLEIKDLNDKIELLEQQNIKLNEEIKYHLIYEDELKSQLTTERCMNHH